MEFDSATSQYCIVVWCTPYPRTKAKLFVKRCGVVHIEPSPTIVQRLLVCAAILEGLFRSWVQDISARFAIGFIVGGLWFVYFAMAGRRVRIDESE